MRGERELPHAQTLRCHWTPEGLTFSERTRLPLTFVLVPLTLFPAHFPVSALRRFPYPLALRSRTRSEMSLITSMPPRRRRSNFDGSSRTMTS